MTYKDYEIRKLEARLNNWLVGALYDLGKSPEDLAEDIYQINKFYEKLKSTAELDEIPDTY